MKKLMGLAIVAVVVASTTAAMAGERVQYRPTALPGPALFGSSVYFSQATPPAPAGHAATPDPVGGGGVALFHCVRVKDPHHIAPCAVPLVIQVKDPCACYDPCSCCKPKCVSVKICVPPCGCPPKITCKKGGAYVKYDYGKYRIEIRSRKGVVTVDYDD